MPAKKHPFPPQREKLQHEVEQARHQGDYNEILQALNQPDVIKEIASRLHEKEKAQRGVGKPKPITSNIVFDALMNDVFSEALNQRKADLTLGLSNFLKYNRDDLIAALGIQDIINDISKKTSDQPAQGPTPPTSPKANAQQPKAEGAAGAAPDTIVIHTPPPAADANAKPAETPPPAAGEAPTVQKEPAAPAAGVESSGEAGEESKPVSEAKPAEGAEAEDIQKYVKQIIDSINRLSVTMKLPGTDSSTKVQAKAEFIKGVIESLLPANLDPSKIKKILEDSTKQTNFIQPDEVSSINELLRSTGISISAIPNTPVVEQPVLANPQDDAKPASDVPNQSNVVAVEPQGPESAAEGPQPEPAAGPVAEQPRVEPASGGAPNQPNVGVEPQGPQPSAGPQGPEPDAGGAQPEPAAGPVAVEPASGAPNQPNVGVDQSNVVVEPQGPQPSAGPQGPEPAEGGAQPEPAAQPEQKPAEPPTLKIFKAAEVVDAKDMGEKLNQPEQIKKIAAELQQDKDAERAKKGFSQQKISSDDVLTAMINKVFNIAPNDRLPFNLTKILSTKRSDLRSLIEHAMQEKAVEKSVAPLPSKQPKPASAATQTRASIPQTATTKSKRELDLEKSAEAHRKAHEQTEREKAEAAQKRKEREEAQKLAEKEIAKQAEEARKQEEANKQKAAEDAAAKRAREEAASAEAFRKAQEQTQKDQAERAQKIAEKDAQEKQKAKEMTEKVAREREEAQKKAEQTVADNRARAAAGPVTQTPPPPPSDPFKEKTLEVRIREFLDQNKSNILTTEQTNSLLALISQHPTLKENSAQFLQSALQQVVHRRTSSSPAPTQGRSTQIPIAPKKTTVNLSEYLKKGEEPGVLKAYITAKGTDPRKTTLHGLLSDKVEKLRIAESIETMIKDPSKSGVEQFLEIQKAIRANKKATGPQFGTGNLHKILTNMSNEVSAKLSDADQKIARRENSKAELTEYIATLRLEKAERDKKGKLFQVGRSDLAKKLKIAENLSTFINGSNPTELKTKLETAIAENKEATQHTPGKGGGRLDKILKDLFHSEFPGEKPTKPKKSG